MRDLKHACSHVYTQNKYSDTKNAASAILYAAANYFLMPDSGEDL